MVLKKSCKFLINSLFLNQYNFYIILTDFLFEILFLKFRIFSLYFSYIFLIFFYRVAKIGIARARLNNDIFTSSMKAKSMATLLALCTAPDFCSLTIYTDS